MEKGFKLYWKLFVSTFYISAFTFGGGYVIVPLMKRKFADEYKWIDEKEILDLVAIAQSAPGPIAINASIIIGYRLAGIIGAFCTILGTVLPPLVIIYIISFFYMQFKDNAVVSSVLKGMSAGVAAVVTDVVIKMSKGIIKEKSVFATIVMGASFAAVFFFNVDIVIIIAACGLLGLISSIYIRYRNKEAGKNDLS